MLGSDNVIIFIFFGIDSYVIIFNIVINLNKLNLSYELFNFFCLLYNFLVKLSYKKNGTMSYC